MTYCNGTVSQHNEDRCFMFSLHVNDHTVSLFYMLFQEFDWRSLSQTRPRSSASWALPPPNSLRYQNRKQPVLSHPFHHASQPQRGAYYDGEAEESLSVCVLVQQGESDGLQTLLEIPLSNHRKLGELLVLEHHTASELPFKLTTVDGSGEDDINLGSCKRNWVDTAKRQHGCFRSLFEAEMCPAPFMYGSHFYCFHCPGTEPVLGSGLKWTQDVGLDSKLLGLPLLPSTYLCSHTQGVEGGHTDGDSEGEQKLAIIYERLRIEVSLHPFWRSKLRLQKKLRQDHCAACYWYCTKEVHKKDMNLGHHMLQNELLSTCAIQLSQRPKLP